MHLPHLAAAALELAAQGDECRGLAKFAESLFLNLADALFRQAVDVRDLDVRHAATTFHDEAPPHAKHVTLAHRQAAQRRVEILAVQRRLRLQQWIVVLASQGGTAAVAISGCLLRGGKSPQA